MTWIRIRCFLEVCLATIIALPEVWSAFYAVRYRHHLKRREARRGGAPNALQGENKKGETAAAAVSPDSFAV